MARFLHLNELVKWSRFNPENLLSTAATVAYDRPSKDTVRFAVAFNSVYDNFNKKLGRKIAEGRLNKGVKVIEIPAAPGKAIEAIRQHLGA